MTLYDDVEREARHDWLNERDLLREPVPPVECPVCGYDDCAGDCTRRIVALGPCAHCGDPCEPGRSLCGGCYQAELVEAITEDKRRG